MPRKPPKKLPKGPTWDDIAESFKGKKRGRKK